MVAAKHREEDENIRRVLEDICSKYNFLFGMSHYIPLEFSWLLKRTSAGGLAQSVLSIRGERQPANGLLINNRQERDSSAPDKIDIESACKYIILFGP